MQLLANLLVSDEPEPIGPIRLKYLLDRYCAESASFLDNQDHTKQEAKIRVGILIGYFGANYDVRTLTDNEVTAYSHKRLMGGILRPNGIVTEVVRARSVQADFKVFGAAIKWAMGVTTGRGKRLLDFNPLAGARIMSERNPKRPVATWDRFQKTRKAMKQLATDAENEADRRLWVHVELALVIFEATGRRRGSVRQLRWEDIDLDGAEIRWRAEADKKAQEWATPIPASLVKELRAYKRKVGTESDWLFPAPRDATRPIRGDVLSTMIRKAELAAGLENLDGGVLHPYRRKWATERKHLSLKDVAAAGGWKDTQTILTCYQQADRDTMLAVMSEPRKVRDRSVAARAEKRVAKRVAGLRKEKAPHDVSHAGPTT
jgi:integrase